MRKACLSILACYGVIGMSASAVHAFDRKTTEALTACHDHVWSVDVYADLPNAAISVWPATLEDDLTKVYWVIDWTDPDIQAAGQCEYQGGDVVSFEAFN